MHEEGAWVSGGTLLSVDVRTGPDGQFEAGLPQPLFTFPATGTDGAAYGYVYDVARDGRQFLFQRATETGQARPMTLVLNWPALGVAAVPWAQLSTIFEARVSRVPPECLRPPAPGVSA